MEQHKGYIKMGVVSDGVVYRKPNTDFIIIMPPFIPPETMPPENYKKAYFCYLDEKIKEYEKKYQ